jgi:hypothetical protein
LFTLERKRLKKFLTTKKSRKKTSRLKNIFHDEPRKQLAKKKRHDIEHGKDRKQDKKPDQETDKRMTIKKKRRKKESK